MRFLQLYRDFFEESITNDIKKLFLEIRHGELSESNEYLYQLLTNNIIRKVIISQRNFSKIKGLKFDGNLILNEENISKFPEDLIITGNLEISYTKITELPSNLVIYGDLDIIGCNITKEISCAVRGEIIS